MDTSKQSFFICGLDLSERFYKECVKGILDTSFSGLRYSAALIGHGSEVLGFDSEMSSDHDWGPRVIIFLENGACESLRPQIVQTLATKLPRRFLGYPCSFTSPDPNDNGTQCFDYSEEGLVNHRVGVYSIKEFFLNYLGFDIEGEITSLDWLTFPEQKLRTITAGRVFHDDLDLESIRKKLNYFPKDVWLYSLASAWSRIEQEEHLMGRAGFVGDDIGSALIGSRLVRDIMRLCFYMEKTYAPYPKWFGTAFKQLKSSEILQEVLINSLHAPDWESRQKHLSVAYEHVASMHNQLQVTAPLRQKVLQFHDRPFFVISMGDFSNAIAKVIQDPGLKSLAQKPLIGAVDQFSDSTDILSNSLWCAALKSIYH